MSENHLDKAVADDNKLPAVTALSSTAINLRRRRFTVAGVAASGTILTLTSRPALGVGVCLNETGKTLSAWASGNCSNSNYAKVYGFSPGYWKNSARVWPESLNRNATFVSLFPRCKGTSLAAAVKMKDGTTRVAQLIDVISAEIYDDVFARSITCAYLNASNKTPVSPTTVEITQMANLEFKPTPTGTAWSAGNVVTFLSQTFL